MLTPIDKLTIKALYKEGYSISYIARWVGVSWNTIKRVVNPEWAREQSLKDKLRYARMTDEQYAAKMAKRRKK